MRTLTIDPGTFQSAFMVWDDGMKDAGIVDNQTLRERLKGDFFKGVEIVGIEMVACFGMAVGKETFETVRWIGRFEECSKAPVRLLYRKDVKIHICGTTKAKDANIRQALIDKYGAPGTKLRPGPTYGVTSHLWSCLALVDYMNATPGMIQPGSGKPKQEFPPQDAEPLPFA